MKEAHSLPDEFDHKSVDQELRDEVLNKVRVDYSHQTSKPIGAYADIYPQLANDDEFLLDLIYTDVLCRERAGMLVAANHYQELYPHLATAIERQLLVHRALADVEVSDAAQQVSLEHIEQQYDFSRDILPVDVLNSPPNTQVSGANEAHGTWPSLPGLSLQAEIGRGGMGIVYRALQPKLKRAVAVKLLRQQAGDEQESLARFRSEAEAIARLRHPHIVQIFDSNVHNGLPFLVLEYIDGTCLSSWCRQPLRSVPTIIRLMEMVARAVDYAHQQQIVHRDLKPANILLVRSEQHSAASRGGEPQLSLFDDQTQQFCQPKIADFGLAKQIQSDNQQLTRTQAILGTAAYLSPEQAWGRSREVSPTTDIHALGIILYELLTGHSPFQGESLIHTLDNVRFLNPKAPSELNPSVPTWLDTVCARCLAKQPRDRYSSAAELANQLADLKNSHAPNVTALASKRLSARVGVKTRRWDPLPIAITGVLACGVLFAISQRAFDNRQTSAANVPVLGSTVETGPFVKSPGTRAATPTRRQGVNRAFLVGVRSYEFPNGSVQLKYSEADVDEMARVLNRLGFNREHIQLLTQWSQADNPRLTPSASNLRIQLKQFLNESIPDDKLIIMLTGMGGETQPQSNYFYLPSDAIIENTQSLMPLGEFLDMLQHCPARQKLLVFDTCQTVSLVSQPIPPTAIPDGVAVLLACSAHQVSYEDDSLRHGVFSHFLLRALEGAGDRDGDLNIRLGELIEFTREHVPNFLAKNQAGAIQTPVLVGTLPLDTSIIQLASPPQP